MGVGELGASSPGGKGFLPLALALLWSGAAAGWLLLLLLPSLP